MTFEDIQKRLVTRVREQVRNGDLTERGFARSVGISQVHMHNVLKGVRTLSTKSDDLILKRLHISVFDLCTAAEINDYVVRATALAEPCFHLPFLAAQVGPGLPWPTHVNFHDRHLVPCVLAGPGQELVLARLTRDCEMQSSMGHNDIAVLDICVGDLAPDALYAVDRGHDVVLRRVRRGARKLYFTADTDLGHPDRWESVSAPFRPGLLRGRVRWLGQALNGPAGSAKQIPFPRQLPRK